MKKVDYLVVGFGLAGMAFCDQLQQHNKSFHVISQKTAAASRVAAGLINPVILKRYTMPWKAEEQFDLALSYFKRLSKKLDVEAVHAVPVYKLFSSVEDQNNWFEASDKPVLNRFIKPQLLKDNPDEVKTPYQMGEVLETVKIDIPVLLDAYSAVLLKGGQLEESEFNYDEIALVDEDEVRYKTFSAQRIVFAEGFRVTDNPFFNRLPLVGNKGEYLIIKAPNLKLDQALKSTFFVIPLGNDLYKVGATFNWKDKNNIPTEAAREELINYLSKILDCDYEIIDQQAGVRPTTGDRRPLLGVHPHHRQLVLLNGLGTRGTMMSPYLAQVLYKHLEHGIALENDVSLLRFPKKF